jgi:hypothetical protein
MFAEPTAMKKVDAAQLRGQIDVVMKALDMLLRNAMQSGSTQPPPPPTPAGAGSPSQ